ncbi:unnamed protein product [Amoebophrya sp. A120]|nr:unnamed protein product [Amoebophrya sp. A120]|eukprot:GSA120T00017485001.1
MKTTSIFIRRRNIASESRGKWIGLFRVPDSIHYVNAPRSMVPQQMPSQPSSSSSVIFTTKRAVGTGRSLPKFGIARERVASGDAALLASELEQLESGIHRLAAQKPFTARCLLTELKKVLEQDGATSSTATSSQASASSGAATAPADGEAATTGTSAASAMRSRNKQTKTSTPPRTIIRLDSQVGAEQGRPVVAAHARPGKTLTFAYLSDKDKARVLQLTEAEGAAEVASQATGKTAFFATLTSEQKYKGLLEWQQERDQQGEAGTGGADDGSARSDDAIPVAELRKLFLSNAAPMIGFGFADNFLMILFGSSIEAQFGMYVSTMAAAGLGNLCSNLVGMSLAENIEYASSRLGIAQPRLTHKQRQTHTARFCISMGTMTGITIGCLLGLAPLWFFDENNEESQEVDTSTK